MKSLQKKGGERPSDDGRLANHAGTSHFGEDGVEKEK